jgi:hypothetical protein
MKKNLRAVTMLLIAATLFSSCSMLTANGRRQRAYERYVRKSSLARVKQQQRFTFKKQTMPVTHPSEPIEATEANGPESVSSGNGG